MKCPNCGAEINDNAKFCPVCGAPQQPQQASNQQQAPEQHQAPRPQPAPQQPPYQQQAPNPQPAQQPKPKNKKGKKALVIVIIAVVAVGVGLYLLFGRGKSISVTEGVEPTFSGGNGYGSVSMDVDVPDSSKNQAAKDFEDKLSQATGDSVSDLLSGNISLSNGSKTASMYQFAMSLDCKWEGEDGKDLKQGKLKNGDKVVYACTYDKNAGKKAGYRFTDLNTTYTVDGLKKVKELDVFENVSVDWNLGDYDAEPEITVKDGTDQRKEQDKGYIYYDYNYTSDGSVTVTASVNEDSLLADGFHVKGVEDSVVTKTFDIGAQPVEITNTSDTDALAAAQKVTDPLIKQDIASCKNTLSEETYDSDTDTPLTIPDNGYTVKGLDTGWDGMEVVYNVTAGGITFERSYGVAVYKYGDGTYKAVSTDGESTSVYCQVYVSEYSDTHTWDRSEDD